jgi:hypothetical protein
VDADPKIVPVKFAKKFGGSESPLSRLLLGIGLGRILWSTKYDFLPLFQKDTPEPIT